MCAAVLRSALVIALLLGSASPSLAFGWEWLDHLSGPGPWIGVQYEQKLFCGFDKPGAKRLFGGSGPCLWWTPEGDKKKENKKWSKRKFAVGVGTRFSWTKQNDLPYAPGTDHKDKRVRMLEFHSFADVRVTGTKGFVHVGGAVGAAKFFGTLVAPALWRPSLEARVSVKVLPTLIKDTSTLDLRFGKRWFLGDLTARDFGATGDYRARDEGVWFAGLVWDIN